MTTAQDLFGANENRGHDDLLKSVRVSFLHMRSVLTGICLAGFVLLAYYAPWKSVQSASVSAAPVLAAPATYTTPSIKIDPIKIDVVGAQPGKI